MTTPAPTPTTAPDQREALKESERRAAEEHPENFKERENEEKIVEIPPITGPDGDPIKGLDPDE